MPLYEIQHSCHYVEYDTDYDDRRKHLVVSGPGLSPGDILSETGLYPDHLGNHQGNAGRTHALRHALEDTWHRIGDGDAENKLPFRSAECLGGFVEGLIDIGDAGHRSDSDGEPGAESDDKDGACQKRSGEQHDKRNPCRGRNQPQNLNNGIDPIADPLTVAAGHTGDKPCQDTTEISQKEKAESKYGTF